MESPTEAIVWMNSTRTCLAGKSSDPCEREFVLGRMEGVPS